MGAAMKKVKKYVSCWRLLKRDAGSGGGKSNDAYLIAVDTALGMTSQVSGTRRCHWSVANNRTQKRTPLIVHSMLTENCHKRASPKDWRRPGMPSQPGSVTASSLAVHMRYAGTGCENRNHSVPGVQSRFQ